MQEKSDKAIRPLYSALAKNSIVPLDKISYVDHPELRINKNESTEMPFRYVKGENGESIMPEVRTVNGHL